MLTRLARWQLRIFSVLTVLAVSAVSIFYLRLPETLGIGTYTINADFAASGGLYRNANVTFRGTTVGRITSVELTDHLAVAVRMQLDSNTDIPADVTAAVKSVSAIGEQYVELTPTNHDHATSMLRQGSQIDRAHTSLSGDVATLLRQAHALVNSLDQSKLRRVLHEAAQAFDGAGPELARTITASKTLVDQLNAAGPDTTALIDQLGPFLDAQIASGQNITSMADGLARFTTALQAADPQVRTVLEHAPAAADSAARTFTGISPSFPVLAANLANVGRIGVIYRKSIEQTLVVLPALTAVLINASQQAPADEGAKVDFKLGLGDPPPCNVGFLPPPMIRSPGDTTLRDLPSDLYCKVPANSPSVVRGARNYPCQEFPGKRAPTVQLCRDPNGYVPVGNQAWRGPAVPEDTPVTEPRNILPPNKYPYTPPGADYDPGSPVVTLPPGVPAGPGPADYAPFPLPVPPVTPGPPPPPVPYTAPPNEQVPPYGQPPLGQPPELPTVSTLPPAGPMVATYDPHSGVFQDPSDGSLGVFSGGPQTTASAQNWVELMLDPRTS